MNLKRYPHFDLDSYLKEQSVYYRKHDGEDHIEYAMNCPICKSRGEARNDTKSRLWVNPNKGTFYCYNCGWDGPLARLVQIFSHCDWKSAIRILKGSVVSDIELLNFKLIHEEYNFETEESTLRGVEFPHGFVPFTDSKPGTVFHDYLKKRGVPLGYACDKGWGYSRMGHTQNRLIVPTYMNDRLVFWQARDVLEAKHPSFGTNNYKKVLNPKGASARHVLYNYDEAKKSDEIILCEGFMDSAKAGVNSVATNGKTLHAAQLEFLSKTNAKSIIILWDGDAYSDEKHFRKGSNKGKLKRKCSAEVAADMLRIFFKVKFVKLPDERDAGSYSQVELRSIIYS